LSSLLLSLLLLLAGQLFDRLAQASPAAAAAGAAQQDEVPLWTALIYIY
jgi:hypothetical protein